MAVYHRTGLTDWLAGCCGSVAHYMLPVGRPGRHCQADARLPAASAAAAAAAAAYYEATQKHLLPTILWTVVTFRLLLNMKSAGG